MEVKDKPIRLLVSVALGILVTIFTSWLLTQYIEQKVQERPRLPAEPIEKITVIVAKQPVDKGAVLTVQELALRELPVEGMPSDVYPPEALELILGRKLAINLQAGKAIQSLHLVESWGEQLSERLATDSTAFTIPIELSWGHGQAIQEGDLFDFYRAQEPSWLKLLSAVPLLALSPKTIQDEYLGVQQPNYQYATFEVPVEYFAELFYLHEQGRLVPILQGNSTQEGPEYLSSYKEVELILPFQLGHGRELL